MYQTIGHKIMLNPIFPIHTVHTWEAKYRCDQALAPGLTLAKKSNLIV